MTDKQAQQIICSLALSSPGYPEAARDYEALLPEEAVLPEGLAGDVLELLRREPETAEAVAYYSKHGGELRAFGVDPLSAAAVVGCVLFVLGSHIKFERDKEGKYYFKFEHKAANNDLLGKITEALTKLLNG